MVKQKLVDTARDTMRRKHYLNMREVFYCVICHFCQNS
jgi:hypothetical protein